MIFWEIIMFLKNMQMNDQKLQMQMEEHKEANQVNFINRMLIHNLIKTINITIVLISWTLFQL